ncbi:MAG: flagellar biosynthetic protein FliO [Bradyrhizobium sp.]|uniref:flagellar biosynthetic protein FliO n=1 Tax=Bradyrhizobium sp. TaxID=376 RepID=UPI001DCBA821|nr:flagellar biosynthetic protein FliO [Bradyrhizobium sp.]MBV9565343.1 flagellar biosynthetic protein FliO [Bradyrhizobium sp.]
MQAVTFFFAFVAVLALIGLAAWLVRRFAGNRLGAPPNRGRMPRLAVIDAAAVDGRRRLVLVRRDNVEHLLMIGGPTDIVVESNIVRAGASREQLPQRPTPAAAEPPARIAPLAEAWMDTEHARTPEHARVDAFNHGEPPMPEPPPRPTRPSFADEMRRPVPTPPPPLPDRRSDALAAFNLEQMGQRPEPPRPEPRLEPRPDTRSAARTEPRIEQRPEPSVLPRTERTEPRAEPRAEPSLIEPRAEPRAEPRPEPRLEPRPEPRPEPRMEPRVEPRPETTAPRLPRGEPLTPRAARPVEAPKPPPLRTPERAAAPPTPPAPPTPTTADQNLAEMAQRLEAALRRPNDSSALLPMPAEPPPVRAAQPPPVRAAQPPPARPASRSEPPPIPPAPPAPPAAPSPRTNFENLEDEMASLLGRPRSSSSSS